MRLRPAAPVLMRSESSVQVGLHRPVTLRDLSAEQARFLGSLEGGRVVGAAESRRHRDLLAALDRGGQAAQDAARPGVVRFRSAAALAVEAATVLARLGWAVAFDDAGTAHRLGRAVKGSSLGSHAAQRVRSVVPGADLRGAEASADLDVLVTVGLPVTAAQRLLSSDAPHLVVRCDEHGATVGPLVTPGDGPCVWCLNLWAADDDDQWPRLAFQCEARRPRTDALVAGLAGMLVARAATAFVSGSRAGVWRVDVDGVHREPDPRPHPRCACGG